MHEKTIAVKELRHKVRTITQKVGLIGLNLNLKPVQNESLTQGHKAGNLCKQRVPAKWHRS